MTWTFDWLSLENRLFEQSKQTLLQFGAEHPDVRCSCFAYDTDPIYGYFLLNFDTQENSLQKAQECEKQVIDQRKKTLGSADSWRAAKYSSTSPTIHDFSPESSFFAYFMYAEFTFPELDEMSVQGSYPKGQEFEDDYIEGNVRVILWKVVERLIADQVFEQIALASPFRIGYVFHDEPFVTLRILNWPHA